LSNGDQLLILCYRHYGYPISSVYGEEIALGLPYWMTKAALKYFKNPTICNELRLLFFPEGGIGLGGHSLNQKPIRESQ
jgi:hypothetical protein